MAKRLILDLLIKFVGEFMELDEDSFTGSFWSGQIKYNNLKLKPQNFIKGYQLTSHHSIVQNLEVTVPWASFLANPIKIKLSGVLLDLGPIDLNQLAKEDFIKGMLDKKIQELMREDQLVEFSQAVSSGASESYASQLGKQILHNLEVSLSDIHVRYEDHLTVPGQVFAAGFTLESFTLTTCDANWQPAFVKNTNKPDAVVNKMAILNNLGVYWEPSSNILSGLPLDAWTAAMLGMIHRSSASGKSPSLGQLHYLLAPVDSAMVCKLIHRQCPSEGSFQYDVCVESKNSSLAVDSQQFKQILQLYYRMDALMKIHDPNSFRPADRPTASSEAAQAWWRYARRLIHARPKYERLVRLFKTAAAEDVLPEVLMSAQDIKEMQTYEARLPLEVLKAFRRSAILDMLAESISEKRRESTDSGSWWGWSGKSGKSSPEDDISLKTLLHVEAGGPVERPASGTPMKITIQASSTLAISDNFHPIVDTRVAFSTSFQSMQGRWSIATAVTDLLVTDTLHPTSLFPSLIAVKNTGSTKAINFSTKGTPKPTLSVSIEQTEGKIKVTASALPIEIFVNKHSIHAVMLAFAVPKNSLEKKLRRVFTLHRGEGSQFLQQAVLAGSQISSQVMKEVGNQSINVEISLEMHGPKIIIPEDCSQDNGCLLLDCGFLSTKGILCSNGQSIDIALKSINAAMPLTFHDFHCLADRQLYLIKPFDLNVEFQSIIKEIADSTVNVSIEPELRGEIDSDKVGRLLRIMTSLSDIASPKQPVGPKLEPTVDITQSTFASPVPKVKRQTSFVPTEGDDGSDSDGFRTPRQMPSGSPGTSNTRKRRSFEKASTTPLMTQLQASLRRVSLNSLTRSPAADRSPTNVDMRIGFKLPILTLDSTYNSEKGSHLIISVSKLLLDVVNRPFDRTIIFDVNEFSVQDSYRHESQKFVVWTPKSEESLIHVHFVAMNSDQSPLYKEHASEVKADFAELFLNVDVNTLLHLQPLFSQLLDKRNRTAPAPPMHSRAVSMESVQSEQVQTPIVGGRAPSQDGMPSAELSTGLQGMKIDMSMTKICVDLLKPSNDQPNVLLESAFSMKIAGMGVNMQMMDLMTATVRLQTFEIEDIRPCSKDFVFKTLFCPVLAEASDAGAPEEGVLLFLTFAQESKTHSFLTVNLSGVTSFVAVDTMLEFSQLAMSNFFTLTSLLSSNDAPAEESKVTAAASGASPIKYSTMNATVKMVNSQLILLEDPAMNESQAIVGRCALGVHYTKEVKTYNTTTELFESVHITITDNEIFALKSMSNWNPLPVLEPFDVECHVKRTVVNNCTVYTSLQMEVDDVEARLSFNDLLLAQAIMSRRALVDGPAQPSASPSLTSAKSSDTIHDEDDEEEAVVLTSSSADSTSPSLMVRFGLSSLRVVVVNDFNAASVPIVRLLVHESNFYSEGVINQLSGEGSAQIKVDYFNARIAVWEPFVDSFTPVCRVYSENLSNIFEVRSDHTLQLTVSGSMLETLLRSYALFFHDLGQEVREKVSASGIAVNNLLGDGISVDLVDSSSKTKLCQVANNGQGIVTEIMDMRRKILMRTFRLPDAVDVHISGEALLSPRMPLVHLPFNITKPKACFLQPAFVNENGESSRQKRSFLLEPIEEEVYENCRYDPLSGQWKRPYFPGDPYEWTDATGLVRKDFESVKINSDQWEWSANWDVDMDGLVGQEIDELGWEYASSFSYFTVVSPRRTFQALDSVRRRRWIRIRSPKASPEQMALRALTVFWDVQPLLNGTRKVDVRSSFQITNKLGFALRICLSHHSWGNEEFQFGPLAIGETFSVPLLKSYATHVRFQPDFPGYEWSAYVPCNVHSYDCKVVKEVICKAEDASSVTFRSWTIHADKAVEVVLLPYITITNKLLCSMQYKLTSIDDKEETGVILSGSTAHCSYVNLFNCPRIAIKMGKFDWSKEFVLNTKAAQQGLLIMQEVSSGPALMLPVCIRTQPDKNFCLDIDVFFQVALVDLSGLDLAAKAKFSQSKDLISNLSTMRSITSVSPTVPSSSSKLVSDLATSSNWKYEVANCDVASNVYVDNNTKWTHLPANLRGQVFVRTAFADKASRSSSFLSFTATAQIMVFVLVDVSVDLKWLTQGYNKSSEIAVARRKTRGKLLEYHFSIYGKVFNVGDLVTLRGAWHKDVSCMYSVAVVAVKAEGAGRLVNEVLFSSQSDQLGIETCWIEGGNHATAFYSEDNMLCVKTAGEESWSEEISIDTRSNSSTKGSFEIVNYRTGLSYQLSYTMQNLPGLYHQTQLVKFMPRYCLLNCTEEALLVSQKGSNKYIECQPYSPEGWHIVDNHFGTEVKLRTPQTLWSLGSINLNEIGTSMLYIPLSEYSENSGSRGVVLHVEVKLAAPTDHCSIIILIWRENVEAHAAMSVHNDSDVAIAIRQSDIEFYHDVGDKLCLYELTVPPGKRVPFGWTDPECGTNVQVAVGTSIVASSKRIAVLNMLKAGQRLRLPYSNKSGVLAGEIILDVTTSDAGHVLHVSRSNAALFLEMNEEDSEQAVDMQFVAVPLFGFNLVLGSVGISLVVEKPHRRELFSLYMDRIEIFLKSKGPLKTIDFTILDLQLDNYSESAVYPILIRSTKKEVHNSITMEDEEGDLPEVTSDSKPGEKPFIELSIAVEQQADKCAVVKYMAFRILSVVVQVDSATMQLLFLDLLDDLKVLSASQALAINMPDRWLKDFNAQVFHPGQKLIDIYKSKASSQQSKMYIKTLLIHPMKVTITFFQTAFPRRQRRETLQSTMLNAMMSLVGVESMQIKLNSFEVEDAMESIDTLCSLILARGVQDVRSQLGNIAGSLAMIGSPVGLARKVGSGVKAFFYEPYLGAVHGSQTFMSGLNKGTKRLFRGVVVGSLESAVAIVGTASRGMAYLTGDTEFVRKRAIKRQQNRAKSGGLYGGFIDGGESLISGISSGVKGLVSKPIEEAATGGVVGFFRGIGLGMLGAAVKPLVGFAEGVTSIAAGLSNQIDTANQLVHVRPPRALQPSAADSSVLVIVALNLDAAFAQDFIMKRARQEQYSDFFLHYLALGIKSEALILSETYIFWRRPKNLWGRVWANVSHCVFNYDSVGIMLYSGALRGEAELVIIPCGSFAHAKRVYAALAQNAYRMGNPAKVLPVDLLPHADHETSSARSDVSDAPQPPQSPNTNRLRLQEEASKLSEIDKYRFGSVNGKVLQQIQGAESDVLTRWQYTIQRGCRSWKELDEMIWSLLWEWGCVHSNLSSCRCCVTLLINRSDSPIQITRVQMLLGRKVVIIGSDNTGYELESRLLRPKGYIVIFIAAFPQSPLEIGHLKANINTVAFSAVLASTQREARCEAKGGFTTGFLEKTVSEWWSKYVILTT